MILDTDTEMLLQEEIPKLVLQYFDMSDFAPEDQAAMLASIGDTVRDRIAIELLLALPDDAKEKYTNLVGANDLPALHAHLSTHIADMEGIIGRAMVDEVQKLRTDYGMALAHETPADNAAE